MRNTDSDIRSRESIESESMARPKGSAIGVAIGVVLVVLGIIAIARPAFATVASTLVFGWLFIIAGVAQALYAFLGGSIGQFVWKLLLGILYVVAGILILSNVLAGALTLTLILGITIFVQGAVQVVSAFAIRPLPRWGALLASGVLGVILGILVWSQWPFNVGWLLGVWVGISLLCDGLWMIALSSLPAPVRVR